MTGTLNDMTPDALRDLAKRAEATAVQKEKEADADAEVKCGGFKVRLSDARIVSTLTGREYYHDITNFLANTRYNRADLREVLSILKDAEQYKNVSSGAVRGLSK